MEVVGLWSVAPRNDHQLHGPANVGECCCPYHKRVQAFEGKLRRAGTGLWVGVRRGFAPLRLYCGPREHALALPNGIVRLVAHGLSLSSHDKLQRTSLLSDFAWFI